MSSSSESVAPLVELVARAPDESTRIDVYDGDLRRVDFEQNLGEVSLSLPPGVYCVTFTRGHNSLRKMAVLEKSVVTVALSESEAPRFVTAAPVRKTSSTREFHREPARHLSLKPALPPPSGHAGGSRLLLFTRDLDLQRTGDPAQGLTLRDVDGKVLYDLAQTQERSYSDCWAGAHLELDAGAYVLRSEPSAGRITEQAIYTRAGWQTQVFLLSRAAGGDGNKRRTDLSNVSLLMAKPYVGFDFEREDLRWTEVALSALATDGNVPGRLRTEMLWAKFDNPMLGVLAALLQLRRDEIDVGALREVFRRLLELVGPLPDVVAIGWGLAMRDASVLKDGAFKAAFDDPQALTAPPMLAESWTHLMRASEKRTMLIPPGSLADRVGDLSRGRGPWLAWQGEPPKTVDLGKPSNELIEAARQAEEIASPDPLEQAARQAILEAAAETGAGARKYGGPFTSLVEKLREPVSEITAALALPYLRTLLRKNPDAGYLLASRRYTDLERRIAFFLFPPSAPALRELLEASKTIAKAWSEDEAPESPTVKNAIESLGVPASTLLRATWSVLKKLLVQPVVPLKGAARSFVDFEARSSEPLRKILTSLADEQTLLRPRAGPLHATALAFLRLYYRGSPAYPSGTTHGAEVLAAFLDGCDYVWSDELAPVSAIALTTHVDVLREKLVAAIADAVKRGELEFDDGWQSHVLPPLRTYERGKLLPAPHKGASPETVIGRVPVSLHRRKWTRVPDGSSLELRIAGEHVAAYAHLSSEGAESNWSHTEVVRGTRQALSAPSSYDVRVEIAFATAGSARLDCRIVKPDGSTYGKPYRLDLSGKAGEIAHAEIRALTVKT
jgi:hypothetical protein